MHKSRPADLVQDMAVSRRKTLRYGRHREARHNRLTNCEVVYADLGDGHSGGQSAGGNRAEDALKLLQDYALPDAEIRRSSPKAVASGCTETRQVSVQSDPIGTLSGFPNAGVGGAWILLNVGNKEVKSGADERI